MIKVAIIDDHSVVRYGMTYMLKLANDMKVVADGSTAADAVNIARSGEADVILLDVRMPGEDGISALKALLEANPRQKVLMLTTSDAEEDVFKSVRGGAKGYVLKETDPDGIIAAIRAVAGGGTSFPGDIMKIYEARAAARGLTPRETEILKAVAKGFTNQDVARALDISPNSVKMHLRHIFDKLGAADRTEAVAAAIRRGIIAE